MLPLHHPLRAVRVGGGGDGAVVGFLEEAVFGEGVGDAGVVGFEEGVGDGVVEVLRVCVLVFGDGWGGLVCGFWAVRGRGLKYRACDGAARFRAPCPY